MAHHATLGHSLGNLAREGLVPIYEVHTMVTQWPEGQAMCLAALTQFRAFDVNAQRVIFFLVFRSVCNDRVLWQML